MLSLTRVNSVQFVHQPSKVSSKVIFLFFQAEVEAEESSEESESEEESSDEEVRSVRI